MKTIYQILALIFLISCTNSNPQDLESASNIKSIFNKVEIEDLNKILSYFDNHVSSLQHCENIKISECYHNYCSDLEFEVNNGSGSIILRMPYKKQQELYKTLNESTFNQIWGYYKYWKVDPKDRHKSIRERRRDTLKGLDISCHGKYSEYLKELGLNNINVKEYYNNLQAAGGISPPMIGDLVFCKYWDLSDINIRLLVAIHYLTLNDQAERTEKY
jgi:hypothetical protein